METITIKKLQELIHQNDPDNLLEASRELENYAINRLFSFDELSEEAKEKAREKAREWDMYHWQNDNEESLKEFSKFFNAKCDYSLDMYSGRASIKLESHWLHDPEEEDSIPLIEFLQDNKDKLEKECPFTGYCFDEDLMKPIRDFLKDPNDCTTLQDLLDESAEAWKKAYIRDWQHAYSDEYIDDYLQANEYKFLENGRLFNIQFIR